MVLADWREAFYGNPRFLPVSQGRGVKVIQDFHCPIMAALAMFSGQLNPDLPSLRRALTRIDRGQANICDSCGAPLTAVGSGHQSTCELMALVDEVLNPCAQPDLERRRLLHEQNRLQRQSARVAGKLDRLGSTTGAA